MSAGTETNLTTGEVKIGINFDGFLNLANGCDSDDTAATLGVNPDVTGSVSITGPASRYIVENEFLAGLNGIGTLNISNQGLLLSGSGSLGAAVGSRGNATITDPGSTWINYDWLFVGKSGDGNLQVEQGGTVSSSNAEIAQAATSTSEAVVRGSGSTWNVTQNLTLGSNGNGTLRVENGGRVTAENVILSPIDVDNQNSVIVAGQLSRLVVRNGIFVGADNTENNFTGTGIMEILDGGKVNSAFGVIGRLSGIGKQGIVQVNGVDSFWEVTSGLEVGLNGGEGQLDILAGGVVRTSGLFVGIGLPSPLEFSNGRVAVAGLGSRLQAQTNVVIGDLGSGDLLIDDGGTVESRSVVIGVGSGSNGTARIAGSVIDNHGIFRPSQIVAQVDLRIGEANGIGNLTVEDAALAAADNLLIGINGTSSGDVTINSSSLLINNQLQVGDGTDGMFGNGTLTLENSAFAQIGQRAIVGGSNQGSTGTIQVRQAAQLIINGPLDIGIFGNGTLNITDAGYVDLEGDLTVAKFIDSSGVVNINGGVLELSGNDIILGDGNHTLQFTDGTLRDVGRFGGDLHQVGGVLELGGQGSFPVSTNSSMSILGDYVLDEAGKVAVDVHSMFDSAAIEVNQLLIDGNAVLEGDLSIDLTLLGDFDLALGDRFNFLVADSLNGQFTNIFSPVFGAGLTFAAEYTTDSVNLVVVQAQTLTADFDTDGDVDSADLVRWKQSFGVNAQADADGDFDSDGSDFLAWQRQFSGATAQATSKVVPEPGSLLLAFSLVYWVARRDFWRYLEVY